LAADPVEAKNMQSLPEKAAPASQPRVRLRRIEEKMMKLPLRSRLKLKADVEDLRRVTDHLLAARHDGS
jgi:hypothetical protein